MLRRQDSDGGETYAVLVKLTLPVGEEAPDVAMLATVTVQVESWPTMTGPVQTTLVDVDCAPGIMNVVP